jgi:uncharacterized protein YidB (DUF937 family)
LLPQIVDALRAHGWLPAATAREASR